MDGDLSTVTIDILVVDFQSLIDENKEPILPRVRVLPDLYQYFDLKIWAGGRFSFFKKRYKNIFDLYEFDFVEFIYLSERQLRNYLKFHKTALLTAKEDKLKRLGDYAFSQWGSADYIANYYDLEVRGKLQ